MTIREIREQLGRVKPYYLRNETLRALAALVSALVGMGNTPPTADVRGPLREAIQLISRDPQVKERLTGPLIYQPGHEKAILALLIPIYKAMHAAENAETHDEALARKVQLDQSYTQALRHIEQNRISEADAEFSRTLTFYKDEHRIFFMIAQALLAAGEVRRAYPYAKRGAEVQADQPEMQELFAEISRQRERLKNTTPEIV
ncbi:MAG: hypothetical protein RRY29_10310 [Desulfovibrionaceae bacterium]